MVEAALKIIDRDGLEAISIRRIGTELGVDGTSLYHHFADKDAILHGVRLLVLQENRVGQAPTRSESWQEYLRRTTAGYRSSLLRHPNAIPLLAPTQLLRPFSLIFRDRVASKLMEEGVPNNLVFPIIDSAETLAYASALLNPGRVSAKRRLAILTDDEVPSLARALSAAPRSPDRIFNLQLEAMVEGWTKKVRREGTTS